MDKARGRDSWLAKNHEFHHRLLAPAEGVFTVAIVERLSQQVERYLRRSGGVHRPEEAGREHRAILAALEKHAVKEAVKVLQQHILSTRDSVLAALPASHPE
jgi:DNA-binding GntR family transcriptional regulator